MCNLGVAPWLAGPKLHEAEKHRKNSQEDFFHMPPRTASLRFAMRTSRNRAAPTTRPQGFAVIAAVGFGGSTDHGDRRTEGEAGRTAAEGP